MHLRWKVFQQQVLSSPTALSSMVVGGEHDHVGCSGRMELKQIGQSGKGGVRRACVSVEVRSSPGGEGRRGGLGLRGALVDAWVSGVSVSVALNLARRDGRG